MKSVVVFQGGGALGAFGAGVWTRLAPWLRSRGDTVVAVAGGSIGAINAAVVAHRLRDPDGGSEALDALWRERIATPSFPFLGWSFTESEWSKRLRSWNGYLSGLLVGNRGLYQPQLAFWAPWHGPQRLERPLFNRQRMQALVEEEAPGYLSDPAEGDALLVVSATELMRGELHLFDSDVEPLKPLHVLASSALPMLFEPVAVGDGLYWDGEMSRQSMLRGLVQRVRSSGRAGRNEPLQVITIELLAQRLAEVPRTGAEITYRALNLMQAEKLANDELADMPGIGRWLRIARGPLPNDGVSGQFDYSPERVAALIDQGDAVAREVLGQVDPPAQPRAVRKRTARSASASSSSARSSTSRR